MSLRSSSAISRATLGLLFLLTLFWGVNWPIMKIVLTEWSVWRFRGLCVLAGVAGLFAIALLNRQRLKIPTGQWPRLIIISFFNITCWGVLATFGLTYLPSGRAATLAFTMPLWSVLLSRIILNEPISARRLVGLTLGMAGLALLVGDELSSFIAAPAGIAFMLGAAITWAMGTVLLKKFPIGLDTAAATGWQILIGGIPIVGGALLVDPGWHNKVSLWPTLGVLYNMLVCFIFCYWAWFRIVGALPAAISALSTLLIPCIGVVSGILVLGEQPSLQEISALFLVIAALAVVLMPVRQTTPKQSPEPL